jgi:hypothetical protein
VVVPGGSGGSGSGAPTDATYITQTANGSLSNEQALASLATGIVKNTTATGVLSIATAGTDYYNPGGTDVAIGDGGTGQSTKTAAFDALSPVTTRGDLIYRDASNNVRLAKGTQGQFLTIGANDPAWSAVPAFVIASTGAPTAGHSPAANTTYYFGNTFFGSTPQTTATNAGASHIPVACTLRAAYCVAKVLGTAGTAAQNVTWNIYKNNGAATISVGSGDFSINTGGGLNVTSASGLSTAFAAGDYFQIQFVTPNPWTTTPTVVYYWAFCYFDIP